MTDEEKKAIEYLKQNSIPILRYDNFGYILSPLYYGTFEKETILSLIEKQQKEIEELKEGYKIQEHNYQVAMEEIEQRYEDKIKANIEDLEKIIEFEKPTYEDVLKYAIEVLQSLLEMK